MASYKGSYLILTAGNTTEPVKLALARRGWVETDEKAAKLSGANSWSVNFLWKPSWNGLRPAPSTMQWSRGHALAGKRSVVNHWKAIEPLTTKDSFFQTMRQYYSAVGKNYADRLPETYVVSGFEKPSQDLWVGWSELSAAMDHHASQGRNLWLAKPTDENRGLGIELMFSKGEVAAFLLKMGRNASMGIKTHWCFQKYCSCVPSSYRNAPTNTTHLPHPPYNQWKILCSQKARRRVANLISECGPLFWILARFYCTPLDTFARAARIFLWRPLIGMCTSLTIVNRFKLKTLVPTRRGTLAGGKH